MLPAAVLAFAERGPDWAAYVDRLPRLVRELCAEWELRPDGESMHGYTALVVPVISAGGPAVLKVGFAHEESEHEHLALQHWRGHGAVRLLRADPGRSALLLERLHTTDLNDLWDVEACEVIAGLYRAIHVPALPQLRLLTSHVARKAEALAALPRSAPLPHRFVEQALSLVRDLTTDDASTGTMIHTDLHYENVLAADREPWLVIDPKPLNGDPHYEIAPLLWNRWEEIVDPQRMQSVRDGVRRRFHAAIDAADLDEHRARDWSIVRMTLMALDCLGGDGPTGSTGSTQMGTCIAILKALQA